MESLPFALPELAAGLIRADRGTAAPLALQPAAVDGAEAPVPFAAVLTLLGAAPEGGEMLPVTGNALPAETTDPADPAETTDQAAVAVPLIASLATPPAPAWPLAPPPTQSPVPQAAAIDPNVLDGAVPAELDAELVDPAELLVLDTRASDHDRASAERHGRDAALTVSAEHDETSSRAPQPLAAWLQQRAVDAAAMRAPLTSAAARNGEVAVDADSEPAMLGAERGVAAQRTHGALMNAAALGAPTRDAVAAASMAAPATDLSIRTALPADSSAVPQPSPAVGALLAPTAQSPAGVVSAELVAPAQPASVDLAAPRWNEALAGRIQWMIDHEVGEARLKLNPPELGALDVKISVQDDKTYVQLAAASAAARDELAQTLPRLRELLSLGGLMLGGATVSGGDDGRQQQAAATDRPGRPTYEPVETTAPPAAARMSAGSTRIDLYA